MGGKVEGEGVDIPGPTFSLVCATPLLQQQVQLIGLNPALKLTYTHTHTHPFNGPLSGTTRVSRYQKGTRSSAIAEGPRDASC